MKKLLLVLIVIFFITNVVAFDDLWLKAQKILENTDGYFPGTITQQFESISKNPKYEFRLGYEVIVSNAVNEEGKVVSSLVSKRTFDNYNELRNNQGIPRSDIIEMRKSVDDLKSNINKISNDMLSKDMETDELEGNDIKWFGLFQETDPKKLILTLQKKQQTINSRVCQVYKVKYIVGGNKKNTETGTVYLDVETGAPVLTIFDFKDLKLPLELKLIKDPVMNTYYTHNEEDNIALPSKVEINISIPFLGNTSSMNTSILMSDYFKKEKE